MKTFDKTSLPAPPAFPASNASYNKIVDKMHKAALGATTSTAAIAAVTSITDFVTGVNTYAKATRRYGDNLIAAINGEAPAEKSTKAAPKKGKTVTVKTAKGDVKVDLKKLEVDPSKHPGGIKEKPGFMLAGDKARRSTHVSLKDTGKTFSNKSNAKRALAKDQLDHLPVEWVDAGEGKVRPVLQVKDDKGLTYAIERGYSAKVVA